MAGIFKVARKQCSQLIKCRLIRNAQANHLHLRGSVNVKHASNHRSALNHLRLNLDDTRWHLEEHSMQSAFYPTLMPVERRTAEKHQGDESENQHVPGSDCRSSDQAAAEDYE